jgi:DNA-binding response OmpR family regulator
MISAFMPDMHHNTKKELPIILLVEDEEPLRRSITFCMMRLGYQVISYGSIDDALNLLHTCESKKISIVLIITDLQLPGRSGLELVRMACKLLKDIPMLVITGHKSREVSLELSHLGVMGILDKPFNLDELVTTVQNILTKGDSHEII